MAERTMEGGSAGPVRASSEAAGGAAGAGEREVARLQDELARVARKTAQLLLQPRYDETELAELDVRARELRARIRSICINREDADLLNDTRMTPTYYASGSLSGG